MEGQGPRFFYSVTEDTAKKKLYLKLVNGSSDAQPVDIHLPDAKLAPEGQLISLTAHDTQATNTLDQPTNIVPVETALKISGDTLHYKVPGYAIQVLVMDLR
jgi:alpha-N-arabinofuranosidase